MQLFPSFAVYLVLAVLTVVFSLYLSHYVDILDKKTRLSGAFIGGVLLAAVTSLPELFTSITAVCLLNEPSLVLGNVFGSNVFNYTILGVCFVFCSVKFKNCHLSQSHKVTNLFTIIIFIMCLCGLYFPWEIPLGIITISWTTMAIIVSYAVNIMVMKSDTSDVNVKAASVTLTLHQIIFRFCFFSAALVIVSILLTHITDILAEQLSLNGSVAGAVFLGVATSLPELASSVNLVRIGNFDAAFGNITGSNLFNFTILCFGDILLKKSSILVFSPQTVTILICGLISAILIMFSFSAKQKPYATVILGILTITTYISSIFLTI